MQSSGFSLETKMRREEKKNGHAGWGVGGMGGGGGRRGEQCRERDIGTREGNTI